jgi:hypothetical protein
MTTFGILPAFMRPPWLGFVPSLAGHSRES